jgi:hypothetical protein
VRAFSEGRSAVQHSLAEKRVDLRRRRMAFGGRAFGHDAMMQQPRRETPKVEAEEGV